MIVRPVAALLATLALLAASPLPKSSPSPQPVKLFPAPNNAQTATVKRYVEAQKAGKYADAFALLNPAAKTYFRNADNYASVFTTDKLRIVSYSIGGVVAGGNDAFRLYFVKEAANFHDPSHDVTLATTFTLPLGVLGNGAAARIKDLGKPWKAFASTATQTVNGLRVEVRKVAYYDTYVSLVVVFANLGDSFVTLLPYGRTALRDETGAVYPIIALKNWAVTDRRLYLGMRLAPNAQYAGAMSFTIPKRDDIKHRFTLTVSPTLRDGTDEPFALDVSVAAARG